MFKIIHSSLDLALEFIIRVQNFSSKLDSRRVYCSQLYGMESSYTLDYGINIGVRLFIFWTFFQGLRSLLKRVMRCFFQNILCLMVWGSPLGGAYFKGYGWCFCQIFQGLRLFQSLEYAEKVTKIWLYQGIKCLFLCQSFSNFNFCLLGMIWQNVTNQKNYNARRLKVIATTNDG